MTGISGHTMSKYAMVYIQTSKADFKVLPHPEKQTGIHASL